MEFLVQEEGMLRGLIHISGLETSVTDLARYAKKGVRPKTPNLKVRGAERNGKQEEVRDSKETPSVLLLLRKRAPE